MIRVDQANRILHFLAARRQLIREGTLSGEALEQKAADMAARWMYRVDAPLHPAYATPVGRAAKSSTAIAAVTAFMKGKLANFQVVLRAVNGFARDKDVKKLAYKLSISVLGMAGAFTAVGLLGRYLSGRKPGEELGGIPGDFVENALGNVYGATEAIRLIRSKSPYGVQVFSSPPVAAAERVGQGLVGLRVAIEKSSGDKAMRAALALVRGSASLAGIPTDQAVNLVRFIRTTAGGQPTDDEVDALQAADESEPVAQAALERIVRRGWTLAKARTIVRSRARREGWAPDLLTRRLAALSQRWRRQQRRTA
jgi:hypothetical protein